MPAASNDDRLLQVFALFNAILHTASVFE